MEPALVILLVVIALVGVGIGFTASRRRGGVDELEPPPAPRAGVAAPEEQVELDERTLAELEEALAAGVDVLEPPPVDAAVEAPVRPSFRDRLGKARGLLAGYVGSVLSRSGIDDETWDDLEEALIRADVGVGLTGDLLDALRARVKAEGITDPDALVAALKIELKERLQGERELRFEPGSPNVWLFVGVNGVGKTTTIGKVGKAQMAAGRSVVMAAGDTFRAAAAEQLGTWAERAGADFVRGAEGADPSSIIYDAVQRAGARGQDLVLADTAGRLHTRSNLMDELRKIRRVAAKEPGVVTEVLLVLDATTGQNGLVQAREFTAAVEITGVVLTKLDGSA